MFARGGGLHLKSELTGQPPACYCLPLQFFRKPGAPETQRQPRRAAVAGMCPGTQCSVCQRKKARRRFPSDRPVVLVEPAANLRSEPRDGPLCASTERTLCCHDYGVLSPIGLKHPSIPAQGGLAKKQTKKKQIGRAKKGTATKKKKKQESKLKNKTP